MKRKGRRTLRDALLRGERVVALEPEFDSKFQVMPSGCWHWTGALNEHGYGLFCVSRRLFRAHRVAYQLKVGPIPDGLVLDHLCRNPRCVNPAHLEPVTIGENIRRGIGPEMLGRLNSSKTHCPKGHPYSGDNVYFHKSGIGRSCRACKRAVEQARARPKAGSMSAVIRGMSTL